jgi:hypothetical protein
MKGLKDKKALLGDMQADAASRAQYAIDKQNDERTFAGVMAGDPKAVAPAEAQALADALRALKKKAAVNGQQLPVMENTQPQSAPNPWDWQSFR